MTTQKTAAEDTSVGIEYGSDDVTKIYFLKLWDMMPYSYRGS